MDWEDVGVHGGGGVLQIDQDLDEAVRLAGVEGEQGVIVELQVIEDFGELGRGGHGDILVGREVFLIGTPTNAALKGRSSTASFQAAMRRGLSRSWYWKARLVEGSTR